MDNTTRQMWQLNKYLWMSLAGVLLYIPIAWAQGVFEAPFWMVAALFCVGVVEGGVRSYLGYRHGGALNERTSAWFNYAEIGMITIGIAISGGIHSDLWLLYFVTMMFESLYASSRRKRLLDLQMTAFYLLGTLPRQLLSPHPDLPGVYARLFAVHMFFLIIVTALGRRISVQNEERGRELALLREQRAGAEERARIAREVHDSLGHALVSIILRLELAARLVSRSPEEAESILKEEIPALRAAWNEGRDLAFHLHPWEQDANGENLPDLLRRHIARFAERAGLIIDFKVEGDDWQLRPTLMFDLTRIVQEALTNAARHAHATEIIVTLACLPQNTIECTIQDNGVGFDVFAQPQGVGLQSMRERAEALGGKFTVQSAPGIGTLVKVEVHG
jgi:signal transduction histidine kinase